MIRYPTDRAAVVEACGSIEDVCKKYNASLTESCFVEGRSIIDFPDFRCLNNPDMDKCTFLQSYGCPIDFTAMSSVNFSGPKCVPHVDSEELIEKERERKVFDPNRCKEGYKLQVNEDHLRVLGGGNIGSCVINRN